MLLFLQNWFSFSSHNMSTLAWKTITSQKWGAHKKSPFLYSVLDNYRLSICPVNVVVTCTTVGLQGCNAEFYFTLLSWEGGSQCNQGHPVQSSLWLEPAHQGNIRLGVMCAGQTAAKAKATIQLNSIYCILHLHLSDTFFRSDWHVNYQPVQGPSS